MSLKSVVILKEHKILQEINKLLHNDYNFKNDYTNKFEFTESIVKIFSNIDYSELQEKDLFDYTKIIDIALKKIIEINNFDLLETFLNILIKLLQYFNEKNYHRYSLEIIRSINQHYGNLNFKTLVQNNTPFIIFEIEKSKNRYFKDKNYHLYRCFCEEIIKIYKISNIEVGHINYEIGLTYHLEAINREDKSSLVKAHFLEQAEKHYKNKCQNIELAKDLRPLIKSCYGLVVENELKEIKVETPITSMMQIELFHYKRHYLKNLKQDLILKQLSIDNVLLPNYDSIVKSVKEIYNQSILRHLFPSSPINEKRKLGTFSTEDEHNQYDILQHYNLNLQLIWDMRLFPIFIDMKKNHRLTPTSIMKHFAQWSLLDNSRTSIIARGIDKFFQNDYISSINILVPQIEHQIRYMFELIGFSTTNTSNGKSQEEQTFSSFLKEEFVIEHLGQDIVKYFEILFVSKIGFNIRNNIAHGFYNSTHFTQELNIIVIYSLIVLTRFNIKKV